MYTAIQKQQLLNVAQQSIQHSLHLGSRLSVKHEEIEQSLLEPKACFITLNVQGELHGCMGSLAASKPLIDAVAHNAHNAAFNDPRFSPLTEKQISELSINIAVLSPLEDVLHKSEQDLIEQLAPGKDGIVLSEGEMTATFLPKVWQYLPEPEDFIQQLKNNAGLDKDYWSDAIEIERFFTEEVGLSN